MIHTPLCPKDCETEHHEVVNALQALAPRFSSVTAEIFSPLRETRGFSKEDFKRQIQRLLESGWKRDEDVPEPSENLKLPLLLLSSMFGKIEAVDWLINEEDFDVSLRSSWTNETALHLVVRNLYVALSPSGSRIDNMSVTEKVSNFKKVVSLLVEKDVSLLWAKDGLNRDTPFHILARLLVNASFASDELDPEAKDLSLFYHCKSFDVLLKLLKAEEGSRLSKKDVTNILCAKNGDGDTVMHILATDVRRGFQVLKFLVKTVLGSTSFLKIQNAKNVTAMDIVIERNPLHAKDLLTDSELEEDQSMRDQLIGGGTSVQEAVSSSGNPMAAVEVEAGSGCQSPRGANYLMPDQSGLARVLHTCPSQRRPQAQVRSIQQQEVSHASPQSAQSGHDTPAISIKQEPCDLHYENQCAFATTRTDDHLNAQSAVANQTNATGVPRACSGVSVVAERCQAAGGEPEAAETSTSTAGSQTRETIFQPDEEATSKVIQPLQDDYEDRMAEESTEEQQPKMSPATAKEMATKTLDTLTDTQYKIDCLHTPLCHRSCRIEHHPLVLTLCGTNNRVSPKTKTSRSRFSELTKLMENTKFNFLKCLKVHLDLGWAKDSVVPDGAEFLRYPLFHLACILLKYKSVELLLLLGFEPKMRAPGTQDYPLHAALRHLYQVGSKTYKALFSFNNSYFDKLFVKLFGLVSSGQPVYEFLSWQDSNGDTVLHVAAEMLLEGSEESNGVEIPDSTQESVTASRHLSVCEQRKVGQKRHVPAIHSYTHCIDLILKIFNESLISNGDVDVDLVKTVLLAKNHAGQTFLEILCKEHHAASACLLSVLSKFPLAVLIDAVKQAVPACCWSCCIPSDDDTNNDPLRGESLPTDDSRATPLSSPEGRFSRRRGNRAGNRRPISESPSSDVQSPDDSLPASSTPIPNRSAFRATPLHSTVSYTESLLNSVLTPVVTNPIQVSLKPNTKRKIVDALKEDYSERLELAIKGKSEVEEDIKKHKENTSRLAEVLEEKKEEKKRLDRELQQLQKDVWHENQAVQALENSLEQFTKEEQELRKSLSVLNEADLEPPSKKSKTQDSEVEDSRL